MIYMQDKNIRFEVLIGLGVVAMFFFTGLNFFPIPQALIGGVFTSSLILAIFEVNNRWLFPKFYISHHTRLFFLYNIILSILFAGLHALLDALLLMPYRIVEPAIEMGISFQFTHSFVIISMGSAIGMALLFNTTLKKQALNEKQLKEDKLGTELKLLKAQINPRFIFNALNNIYSLAYTKSENTAISVLKLSKMLHYVLDECQADCVKLSSEVSYIENYISFQKIKSGHEQKIQFKQDGVFDDELISPMLLIPFIENSIKYSKIEEESGAWIEVNLAKTNKGIIFFLRNSIPKSGKPKSGSGMGIANVNARLNLLYPCHHQLAINEDNNSFSLNLILDLK